MRPLIILTALLLGGCLHTRAPDDPPLAYDILDSATDALIYSLVLQ